MSRTPPNSMLAQVQSLPELIRTQLAVLDARVHELLGEEEARTTSQVVITGCGDSHMAGVAAELALQQIAGVPTRPLTALHAARYAVPYLPLEGTGTPLVLGISVSGSVARTREALLLARQRGAATVAITANPESLVGRAAAWVLDCTVPAFPFAPGVRSYRASLLALYLLAIRLGELRGHCSPERGSALRASLLSSADAIAATIARVFDSTRSLAEELAHHRSWVFVGDGPNLATALFGAAKVIEAAGRHALGQETEEWAHLQYFTHLDPDTPTVLISPGGRGHARMAELVEPMRRIGRTLVAVVPEGDAAVGPHAQHLLPVSGKLPEAFTPLVYPVACELLAAHLADALGEPFFRGFAGPYGNELGGNAIQESEILESLDEWE